MYDMANLKKLKTLGQDAPAAADAFWAFDKAAVRLSRRFCTYFSFSNSTTITSIGSVPPLTSAWVVLGEFAGSQ